MLNYSSVLVWLIGWEDFLIIHLVSYENLLWYLNHGCFAELGWFVAWMGKINTGGVLEVRLYFRSELEFDLKLQMCQLDGTGPGLDLVIVSGCEPFRLRLSDLLYIRVI
jgi:hypothetical protein